MNMAQLSNAKALEEFENLFIYEKDYEDFFEDTYGTKNPDYNLYDLVAKYGIAKVVADFIKWQDSHKVKVNDVVPVVRAKWERVGSSSLIDPYRCSNCHKEPCKKQIEKLKTWGWDFTDYCPRCGAKMDKE